MGDGGTDPSIITSGAGQTRVFVYGSLKRQHANHPWLEGGFWLGEGHLVGVQLFDLGPFPMAVPSPTQALPLQGELYGVTWAMLERLDRLEGSPRLFQRHWLQLGQGNSAWVYLGREHQVRNSRLIPSGIWQGPRQPRWRRPERIPGGMGLDRSE